MDGTPSAADSLRSWRLDLPYQALPLSLNARGHRMEIWRAQSNLKNQVRTLTRAQNIPRLQRIHVELHWLPAVHRTRDQDNAVATLKPAIDGLRDYSERRDRSTGRLISPAWTGIVPDDSPAHVAWSQPIIHPPLPNQPGKQMPVRLWLIITDLQSTQPKEHIHG